MTPYDVGIGNFFGRLTGRAGHIIYREPPKELTIYWEMTVKKELDGSRSYGISVTCDSRYWSKPRGALISGEHQLELLAALREWLHARGMRSSIDLRLDLSEESTKCL
jgi:hypothetical protein